MVLFVYIKTALEFTLVVIHTLITMLLVPFPYKVRIFFGKRILRSWAFLSRLVWGIKLHYVGEKKKVPGGTIVISNHISFWDIFILGSMFPTVFLAKAEVRKIPVLGLGAWAAGVLYVDRSSKRSGAKSIIDGIKSLKQGATVIVFPEGTTSPNEELLAFKPGAFSMAYKAHIPIQPVAFAYEDFENEAWGDLSMGELLKKSGSKWSHHVHVCYGDVIYADQQDPKEFREKVFKVMNDLYKEAKAARDKRVNSKS